MRLDDIDSPGLISNSHTLRKEVVRGISFCEIVGSSEKAVELQKFFRQAIDYLDREIVSKDLPESEKPILDPNAISPFEEEVEEDPNDEIPDHLFPVPRQKKVVGRPAVKGKR